MAHRLVLRRRPPRSPHEIQIDLGARYAVDGLGYLPRQDGGVNGRIGGYEVYVSDTATDWGPPVVTGTFADTAAAKAVALPPVTAATSV